MKYLFCLLIAFPGVSVWADGGETFNTSVLQEGWDNPKKFLDNPDIRPSVDKLKSTLNIGSDEDLIAIAKSVSPEIIKKVIDLKIELTPKQMEQLEKLAMDNKGSLVAALFTGNIPKGLLKEAEKIVPELQQLDEKSKAEVFKAAGKTVNKMVFDKMINAELMMGYLSGDVSSGVIAELNAKLLNIRKITLGGISIEDVHMKVQIGYPKNGFTIISGKVSVKDSKFSYQGELLGLSHDIRKQALDLSIAKARINYNILPWLQSYGEVNLGLRSYADGTSAAFDPKLGVEVNGSLGPVKTKVYVEGSYRVGDQNAVLCAGGNAGLQILNNDFIQMQTGIMSQINLESNPRQYGNSMESINTAGISGRF